MRVRQFRNGLRGPFGRRWRYQRSWSGCRPDSEAAAPQARPVRTITVEKHEAGSPVTLTGRIEAKDEVALGFRISGRLLENKAKLGNRVKPGEMIARLESQNELNQLRSAEANLAAARAQLTQAQNHFERQDTLLQQGWTTARNLGSGEQGAADRSGSG